MVLTIRMIMPPPVLAPGEKMLGLVAIALFSAVFVYLGAYNTMARRRHVVRWLGKVSAACALVFLARALLGLMGFRGWWVTYVAMVTAAPFFPNPSAYPKRPRKPPKRVRNQVIERHELVNGPFDPQEECVDHIYPFSKGGDHTLHNLRVIPKAKNLKKRDKDPDLTDWIQSDLVALKAFILKLSRRSMPRTEAPQRTILTSGGVATVR